MINLNFLNLSTKRGVEAVQDFLDEDGNFLSYDVFQQLFNLDDFCNMKYNRVILVVPKYLKVIVPTILAFCKELL